MSVNTSKPRKCIPVAQHALRSSGALYTTTYSRATSKTYDRLTASISQLSLDEASAAWQNAPELKGQLRTFRARHPKSSTTSVRHTSSPPLPRSSSLRSPKARAHVFSGPYPHHSELDTHRTSRKHVTKEPWLEPSPASTIPLHNLTMSAWIHGQTPSAPVSRFTSDVVANAQAGRPLLQLSDVAARTIRKKVNPSGGLLHPATWEPPVKQSKRLRSHSNNSVNALGRQLKRTKLADPKVRKDLAERVARKGYNLTGDIRSPAGQHYKLLGPAAVPPPFAVGPISDDVISQYVVDPNAKSSSYGSRSAALTEEQLLALEEDIFGDEDESDYDYDDDEEEDEYEYYYESSSSSSSSSGSHKGKGVDPRERPAPQINAQTFPVEAERYETEEAMTVYSVPAEHRTYGLSDFGHTLAMACATAYMMPPWVNHPVSSIPAVDTMYEVLADEWEPSSSSSSEYQDSDYSMEVYSDDEDL